METMNSWFDEAFSRAPVMAILRGFAPARTVELAQRGWDAGITCIEVPIQSASAIDALNPYVRSLDELRRDIVQLGTGAPC